MPFTACKHEKETTQRQKQKQKHEFTMTSGGFVIVVRNNSFIDSK